MSISHVDLCYIEVGLEVLLEQLKKPEHIQHTKDLLAKIQNFRKELENESAQSSSLSQVR